MRKLISTTTGSAPLPYSRATIGAGLVFTSGHLPVAEDGTTPEDFTGQVVLTLDNLENTLRAAGSSLSDLLRVNVYLASLDDFDAYNRIYIEKIGSDYPSRTTVEVTRFRGTKRIEIDAIALAPETTPAP